MNHDITIIFSDSRSMHCIGELIKDIYSKEELWSSSSIEIRTALSLSEKVSKKLRSKAISKEGTSKEIKVKLPYEYASTLFLILKNLAGMFDIDPEDIYTDALIDRLKNNLHKELI